MIYCEEELAELPPEERALTGQERKQEEFFQSSGIIPTKGKPLVVGTGTIVGWTLDYGIGPAIKIDVTASVTSGIITSYSYGASTSTSTYTFDAISSGSTSAFCIDSTTANSIGYFIRH